MLNQCLENTGEGLLHACISSIIVLPDRCCSFLSEVGPPPNFSYLGFLRLLVLPILDLPWRLVSQSQKLAQLTYFSISINLTRKLAKTTLDIKISKFEINKKLKAAHCHGTDMF
jgi:hypothetical protein